MRVVIKVCGDKGKLVKAQNTLKFRVHRGITHDLIDGFHARFGLGDKGEVYKTHIDRGHAHRVAVQKAV